VGSGTDGPIDSQYEDLLRRVLEQGTPKQDRTGTGTVSLFGERLRYDLSERFPWSRPSRCTSGRSPTSCCGSSAVRATCGWLRDNGVTIWDEWASPEGDLGPVYGVQWRSWPAPDGRHIDQISSVLSTLRSDPDSRRMIVSAWNVAALPDMALAPCHTLFQFYVAGGRLSCQLYQRSADMFLGVPFNIASYALLTRMVADQVGLAPGDFIWVGGDCHVYSNHTAQVREQLSREVLPFPTLELAPAPSLFDYTYEHFTLHDYRTTRRSAPRWRSEGRRASGWSGRRPGGGVIGPAAGCLAPARGPALFRELTTAATGRHGPAPWDSLPERFRPAARTPQRRPHHRPVVGRRRRRAGGSGSTTCWRARTTGTSGSSVVAGSTPRSSRTPTGWSSPTSTPTSTATPGPPARAWSGRGCRAPRGPGWAASTTGLRYAVSEYARSDRRRRVGRDQVGRFSV
jgi:thymidylate synthase